MKKLVLVIVLAYGWASAVLADRPVDQTLPAEADSEVSIELIAGSVRVIGWERAEVQVSGTVGDGVERVAVESHRGRVSIEVELVDLGDDEGSRVRTHRDGDADLEIRLPAASRLQAESISAALAFEGLAGSVSAESVSGAVEIRGSLREVEVETVSGSIRIASQEPLHSGEFASVSGDIELRAPLGHGEFDFETVSGNVVLRLPRDTAAEFEIETFSGRIENQLGPESRSTSEHAPGRRLEFSTGGGDARVEIETFSGKVALLAD